MLASEILTYEDNTHKQIASHLETYKFRGIDIYKIKSTYSSGYYYQEEVTKKSIVLHFTAGYLAGDINVLTKKNYQVSVPFVIARNGKIYQLHNPKYWSYHLGLNARGGNKTCSKQTIGIEISNIGPLTIKDKKLYTYTGGKYCNSSEKDYYKKASYRNKSYYATFTKAQYQSLKKLLPAICAEFDIPYKFLPENERNQVFKTDIDAQDYTGICSHANFRKDKYDIGPAFDWDHLKQLHLPAFEMSEQNLKKSYQQINVNSLNQFPMTSYGWWHNGIHLFAKKTSPLFAIADGQIVYSRISSDIHEENGSANFVLIKHQIEIKKMEITFYALYMHLKKLDIQVRLQNKKSMKSIPPWILNKFYKMQGRIIDVYSDGCVSMYADNNDKPSKNEITKLIKGNEFDILESAKKFGGYEITKIKINDQDGWIYSRDKTGKLYSQTYLKLHSWALDSNQRPREDIFQKSLSYEKPINTYSGQTIGYVDSGLSHVEILNQGKVIKKKETYCHLEIFSRQTDNNNQNIYDALNIGYKNYLLLEDKDNHILQPALERKSVIKECQKKIPTFQKYTNMNLNGHDPAIINVNKDKFLRFVKDHRIQFRDSVAFHISGWQALQSRIKSSQYPLISELECFHLFKSTEKKSILDANEKLFFYHPIRFIEKLHSLLKPNIKSDEKAPAIVKKDSDCIIRLKERGIVNKSKDFRHEDPVKRCEFIKMLLLSLEYNVPDKNLIANDFTDVKQNDWFAPYVYVANLCKIAQGYRDANGNKTGEFGSSDNTTISQALKMAEVAQFGYEENKRNVYDINGKKTGNEIVTREQAASLICRLLDDNSSEHISNRRDTLVRRIEGPKTSDINKSITYSVVQYAQESVSVEQKRKICWLIKDENNNSEIYSVKEAGEKLEYVPSSIQNNTTIRVIAYRDKPSLETSVTTFLGNLRFFIKKNDGKKYISYYDVAKKEFYGTNIHAEKNGQEELFARITRYGSKKYGYRYGLTTIYNGKERPRPSVSDYSESRHKIAAAVSNNEGSYVDTQSYDSGILSHGTTQWTMASKNLHSLLNDYKSKNPKLFNQYFVSNGVDINGKTFYIKNEALGDSHVTFQLAYYLWKSGYVKEFQEIQFNKLASRIDSFYPEHVNYKNMSKYYTSENSIAHLLDLNVNRPAYVPIIAKQAVNTFNTRFPDKKDPNAWTDEDEGQLIKIFLNIRKDYGGDNKMTKSQERATNINNISELSKIRNSYQ